MTLLRQTLGLSALAWMALVGHVYGAGPIQTQTFTRTSHAPATATEAFMNGHANQGMATAAIIQANANLIKQSAEAVEITARAADLRERTRTVALDNELKATKNFYEKRQLRDSYTSLTAPKRATKEDLIRYSKDGAPSRAASYQLCTASGAIRWPGILKREEFSPLRVELDCLFQKRQPTDGELGSEFCHEVQVLTDQMRDELRAQLSELSPAEYATARRFIDALAREAELPVGVPGLAAR
ncbi:MAG: hypothetical protein ABFD16_20415 [Thermoguttaceae bacterium]